MEPPEKIMPKRRLYFLIQGGIWGGLALPELVALALHFGDLKPGSYPQQHPYISVAAQTTPFAIGFVLTHFSRFLIERWGWKQLGPGKLLPRIAGLSGVLALIAMSGIILVYCWLTGDWTNAFKSFLLSVIVFALLFAVWLSAYFLYHTFERSNRAERDSLRLAAQAQQAELAALRSQINPHFIFNSLNSLRALIEEDSARARQAVTQLANLLRYALQSSQLDAVPLEEELRMVRDYLALEQLRYEERLQVTIEVAPETLALRVPPMLLQTLVENAVKYGIAEEEHGGAVTVSAQRADGCLRLLVTNPGQLRPAGAVADGSTGVGLRNATERLRLLFGPGGKVEMRRGGPHLVVAEALIPFERTGGISP